MDLGAHDDRAAPGGIGGADARAAENRAPRREIRPRNMLHQILDGHVRLVHQREQSVDRLAQIVRRDIGRHADRDAARAVDEQIGKARRQDRGLELLLVVVRLEVDRVLVEVLQQGHRDLLEPRFGVPRGCRRVAVDRAEIALPIDQRRAHGKILRHAHQRVVDREIAVRVELAHRLADGARRLVVRPIGREIQLAHRVENAPMHRLQTVAHVGKRAADDHAHRVIEIAALHLVEDRNRLDVLRAAARGPFVFVVSQFGRVLRGKVDSVILADFRFRRHLVAAVSSQNRIKFSSVAEALAEQVRRSEVDLVTITRNDADNSLRSRCASIDWRHFDWRCLVIASVAKHSIIPRR